MKTKNQTHPSRSFLQKLLFVLLGMAAGFGAGVGMAWALDSASISTGMVLFWLAGTLVGFYVQLILHEAGHLVCGLATGYRFVSFRIGSWAWQREQGRIRLRRFHLAGTAGQCLLAPPPLTDGKMPYILYNLGGPLANLLTAVMLGLAAVLLPGFGMVRMFCGTQALVGLLLALTNGLPLRGTVNNDGSNALSLGRDPAALRSLWVQLSVNARQAEGVRLREMPAEWFTLPPDDQLQNSMTAVLAILCENRRMDAHDFDAATELIDHLDQTPHALMPLYQHLLLCDRLTIALLRREDAAPWLMEWETRPVRQFRAQMKEFPAVLRTEYAAALHLGDAQKAAQLRTRFVQRCASYPYPAEVQSEQELMDLLASL